MGLFDIAKGLGSSNLNDSVKKILFGSEGEFKKVPTMRPEQEEIWNKYKQAVENGFEDAANYYRQILADDPELYQQLFAPEIQRYERETIPQLAEQFAGLGSGGINSSGFQQAGAAAGADLNERLASMRANLKNQAASGMSNLSQGLLTPIDYTYYQQPQPGLVEQAAGAGLQAAGAYYGVPMSSNLGQQKGQSIYANKPMGV